MRSCQYFLAGDSPVGQSKECKQNCSISYPLFRQFASLRLIESLAMMDPSSENRSLQLSRIHMSGKFPFLILFIFMAAFSSMNGASSQYENQPIERLDVIIESRTSGSCDLSVNSITSRITTREGGFFSQNEFDSDLKILARDFDLVEPELQSINGHMSIVLKVWSKPQIRSIRWHGNTHIKTTELRKELGIKPLSTFDRLAFNKAFHKIKAYYVKQGFFEAELSYDTVVDPDCNEVDIDIKICEGRAGHIKNIIFCGFTSDEESDLLEQIITKKYNFFFSWYTGEGTYHEEAIQQDQFVILNYLQNEGYADARVEIEVKETCNNKIDIYINADRGEIYRVGRINFSGNTLFSDCQIENEFTFGEGSPYSPEAVRKTLANISDLYGRKGYIDANVDFEPSLDPECRTYSLKMTIEEEQQYRVGMIKVFGNCVTQTSIILHESLLIPGEIFNIEKLKLTEQKLTNVGYFETVNVYAVKSEGPCGLGENYRDVHIEVKETSTGHFGAFFGYSTSESVFGGINITERNFNCRGLGSVWTEGMGALRGGGEYAHGTIQVGLKSRKYIVSWAKPFFRDTQWTVGFDLERNTNRYISDDYEINSTALIVHATYKLNPFLSFGWHYRIKNSDVEVSGDHKNHSHHDNKDKKKNKKKSKKEKSKKEKDGVKSKGSGSEEKSSDVIVDKSHKGNKELEEDARLAGLISASGVSLIYDSTDHPVTPRQGFRSKIEVEYAGIGGDHTFFSLGYLNSYFYPLGKKSVFKTRADFRFILPFGNTRPTTVPLDERFFLGGDAMVRGYRSYRLGPVYPDSDDPRGGISEQYYSLEITRRLHPKVEAFAFCDGGFLSLHRCRIGKPFVSVGAGARIRVIDSMPSITLGYGIPLNATSSSQEKRFFISLGGQF